MKLIKPLRLGLLTRPYTLGGSRRLAIAALGFFPLGKPCDDFLPEPDQWLGVLAALPRLKALDEVFAKPRGEVLLAGRAYAPGGNPAERVDVRLRLGPVDKTVRVWGERRWYYSPWYRITPPMPFLSMPLEAGRAYGGPGHPQNPEGCGYTGNPFAGWLGRNEGAMPNLEFPSAPIRGHVARRQAALFGPLDPSRPPRRRHAGTYGRRWRRAEAPGLPSDLDPRFFQTAPADQWNRGPWRGDEAYRLENLHPSLPVIEGTLPGLATRAFARSKADGRIREAAMALDTVWLLPDLLLGVAIHHGTIEIDDCDGLDIDAVLVAYERLGTRRPAEEYEQTLTRRTDPATALYHALADKPLVPVESAEAAAARAAARAARTAAALEKRQAVLDELAAEHWQRAGLAPPPGFTPPRATTSPFELDLDAVREGDIDLGQWLDDVRAEAERRRDEALRSAAAPRPGDLPPKPADPEKEKRRIYERAAKPAWDLIEAGPPLDGGGEASAPAAAARAQFTQTPALQRLGRRAALRPAEPALPPDIAEWLGHHVRQWRKGAIFLAGRDLAGAELRRIDLAGADLRETIFEGCDLRGASFAGADLRGASFVGARLDDADLGGCRLGEANLSACSARGARFAAADLGRAWAMEADFSGGDFDGATLDGLLGHKAILTGASLRRARLDRAMLVEMRAADSFWDDAELSACALFKADLARASFTAARLTRCVLLDAVLDESDLSGARLERCVAIGASFKAARAPGLRSEGSGFHGVDWRAATLTDALCASSDFGDARLDGADLSRGLFTRCLFQGASLSGAQAVDADFWRALCRRVDFSDADLRQANLRQAALDEARFDGADLRQARFDDPQLRKLKRAGLEVRP